MQSESFVTLAGPGTADTRIKASTFHALAVPVQTEEEARGLAEHAVALRCHLDPWPGPVPVVFHGGVLNSALYAGMVKRALADADPVLRVVPPVADAVAGALRLARAALAAG